MSVRVSTNHPAKTPQSYKKLLSDITRLYKNVRRALAEAYWQIGRRIVEVEQDGAVSARYGDALLQALSRDLLRTCGRGFSEMNLRRMRSFYLKNPIQPTSVELDWSQQAELLPIQNAKRRLALEQKTLREGLTSRQIRALVRAESASEYSPEEKRTPLSKPVLLIPKRGTLYTYQIVEKRSGLSIDRGFKLFWKLTPRQAKTYQKGDIVEHEPGGSIHKLRKAGKDRLYTYEADSERVVDGDTLWMHVYVNGRKARGYREEKLRLRGIDSPELDTPEGRAAKKFVEDQIALSQSITITTTKPDKWARYLTDLFLLMKDGAEVFLNNLLLEKGFAVPKDKYSLSDWGEFE